MKLTHATPRINYTWLLFGIAGFRNVHWFCWRWCCRRTKLRKM